jgi:hypothetical protein
MWQDSIPIQDAISLEGTWMGSIGITTAACALVWVALQARTPSLGDNNNDEH